MRALALDKLRQKLDAFHVYGKRVRDIVSLAQYAYNNGNTCDSDIGERVDELRGLVVQYIVCVYETMAGDTNFLKVVYIYIEDVSRIKLWASERFLLASRDMQKESCT